MNAVVWIAQGLLALAMLAAGSMKLSKPKAQLQTSGMAWVEDLTEGQVKGIGTLEVFAAVGLILPALLDIAPVLVAVPAVGVALLMLGAAATHVRRGEGQMVPVNLVIAGIALFIAIRRFGADAF
jgi:hypothetical protein